MHFEASVSNDAVSFQLHGILSVILGAETRSENGRGMYEVHSISFQTFFVQTFIIAVNLRYFSMLLLYSL